MHTKKWSRAWSLKSVFFCLYHSMSWFVLFIIFEQWLYLCTTPLVDQLNWPQRVPKHLPDFTSSVLSPSLGIPLTNLHLFWNPLQIHSILITMNIKLNHYPIEPDLSAGGVVELLTLSYQQGSQSVMTGHHKTLPVPFSNLSVRLFNTVAWKHLINKCWCDNFGAQAGFS